MSSFCFPANLPVDEIVACLTDLNVRVDASQLSKPTYENVRLILEQAVLSLNETSREEMTQLDFNAMDVLEYPELHEESIPNVNFFHQVTQLMDVCGVKDFTLNDVYKPDVARFKRILCGIINFAKYRDDKLGMLEELETEQAAHAMEEQALQAEVENTRAELKRLKEQRAARQLEAAPVHVETEALAAQAAQLNSVQSAMQVEVRNLKAQLNTLAAQASDFKISLSSLHSEIEQLQEEIVQSPDKLRAAVAEIMNAIELQRTYYTKLCSQSNDYDRKMEMIGKFERELQRCLKLQEEVDAAVARKQDVSAAVKDTREAIAVAEREYSELEAAKQTARLQLSCVQEKLNRLENQCQLKLEAALSRVEEQRKAREALEAEVAAEDARAAEVEAQVRACRERTAEVVANKDVRVRAIKEKFTLVLRAVSEYNRKMDDVMSAPLPDALGPRPDQDMAPYVFGAGNDTGNRDTTDLTNTPTFLGITKLSLN